MTAAQSLFDRLGLSVWSTAPLSPEAVGRRNMLLLIVLRWLAVTGQVVTIFVVHMGMAIPLPLDLMLLAPIGLALVNLITTPVVRRRSGVSDHEILLVLLLDVVALTWLLFLSGGAENPFVALYLLQVVLAAVLLRPTYAWALIIVTGSCFGLLTIYRRPLILPTGSEADQTSLFLHGAWVCFVLVAVLLVMFVTRISQNLRARDAYLAQMRQQAAEEDHIVRMGLLASGAAHELGTPLASLSVILSDWRRMPHLARDPEMARDIKEMQDEVERCKGIVTRILISAGEARGQAPARTTVQEFLDDIIANWVAAHPSASVSAPHGPASGVKIIADPALEQVFSALLDNAAEAGALSVIIRAAHNDDALTITFEDDGPGFAPQILANIGKPYQSTKGRAGAGLGLFLLVNVVRKFGGTVQAQNMAAGGAQVSLELPLSALTPKEVDHG